MPEGSVCEVHDARLRTLEQNLATELGESRQFRHDMRNWRTAVDGQNAVFQQELLDQSKRIGQLEQYRAKHEAEYAAKIEKIGSLAEIEARIEQQIAVMDAKLEAQIKSMDDKNDTRLTSLEHKVAALIVEKAVAKWAVGLLAGVVVLIGNIAAHKLGWL